MTVRLELEIVNEKGLHARASAKFVDIVGRHESTARVTFGDLSVSGDSIMGLLTLAVSIGMVITVEIEGSDEAELAKALTQLVKDRFNENY